MLTLQYIILFIADAICQVFLHVYLKKSSLSQVAKSGFYYYWGVIKNPLFAIAMAFYLLSIIMYMYLLAFIPLSVVYPVTGIQNIFVIFYARYLLHEHIGSYEYGAILLIQVGVILVGLSQG